jgi:uncharacterized Zn finger protein (UPF0148 family)
MNEPPITCARDGCGRAGTFADAVKAKGGEWLCPNCRPQTEKVAAAERELAEAEAAEARARKRAAKARAKLEFERKRERELADVELPMTEERDPPTAGESEAEEGDGA